MSDLIRHKEELIATCELEREMVRVQVGVVKLHLSRAQDRLMRFPRAWKWLAPMAGLLVARRLRRSGKPRMAGRPMKWLIGYKLLDLWLHRRRRSRET